MWLKNWACHPHFNFGVRIHNSTEFTLQTRRYAAETKRMHTLRHTYYENGVTLNWKKYPLNVAMLFNVRYIVTRGERAFHKCTICLCKRLGKWEVKSRWKISSVNYERPLTVCIIFVTFVGLAMDHWPWMPELRGIFLSLIC